MTMRRARTITRTRTALLSTSRSIRVDAGARGSAARAVWSLVVAAAATCVGPAPARAHGFGQRYDLPLPLSLYLFGTAATIVFWFIGNLWAMVNPWRTLFDLTESIYRRVRGGRDLSLRLEYPRALGVWPAFALLLAFTWTELVYPSPAVPAHIAWLLVGYSVLTWTGMAVYGSHAWLRHSELFTVIFSLFARFAPTEVRVLEPALCERC